MVELIFPGAKVASGRALPLTVFALLVVQAVGVLASEPLYVKNLNPVSGLIGLPSQRVAATAQNDSLDLFLHTSIANYYVAEAEINEGLNLDGETQRIALEVRYGLGERWDIQLEVPWMDYSGGFLDSAIENWHSFWGTPDGDRPLVAQDELDIRYRGPATHFELLDDTSGLGDISLALTHAFYLDDAAAASITLGYKFATGDEDELLGSGADDVYLALRFSGDHLTDLPLSWHGQLGYLRAGDSDVLAGARERDLWFAGLALDWAVAENWSVIGQLDVHAAPMDSAFEALGDEAIMVSLGTRWRISPHWVADFSFIEDARVTTAPDITFQASVRYYGKR